MPPDRFPPDDPREWLNRARSNLTLARVEIPGVAFEDLCFDAQQAAEKAIKAVFIARGVDFPYVHDLTNLLTILEHAGETIPSSIWDAVPLTRYAVVTRYPGMGSPVTAEDHAEAVRLAEAVLMWAEQQIQTE